jgi:dTDP-4-amino-4,6-dideoxygalactose transaminase
MKSRIDDLAIFSGPPAFHEKLYVGRPNIGSRARLLKRIKTLLDKKWLTNDGPFLKELEQKIAEKLNVRHCVAVCNATVALEIAIRALGLAGEVIIPSFTFIATAHALQWQNITPVFCDIDPLTHNLDPRAAESMVTSRTTGIIGVHLWGRPCNVEALSDIADRNNLKLLFDAAHAFCCSYKGTMIGNFGNAEVFSFHATKFFNTFEGGAIVTNDDELAKKLQLMRNFGFADYDQVSCLGINGKMSEVSAAMGLTSLESLEEFVKTNYRNYKRYQRHFAGIPGVTLMTYDESENCNYQYIVLEIDESITEISRDQMQKILWIENIMARRYFYPGCHRMEPYSSYFPEAGLRLQHTEHLVDRVLSLPTGTAVGKGDIDTVCQIIKFVVTHGAAVKERLGRHSHGMHKYPND